MRNFLIELGFVFQDFRDNCPWWLVAAGTLIATGYALNLAFETSIIGGVLLSLLFLFQWVMIYVHIRHQNKIHNKK